MAAEKRLGDGSRGRYRRMVARRAADRQIASGKRDRFAAGRDVPSLAQARTSGRSDLLMRVTTSSHARFSRSGYFKSKQCTAPPALDEKLHRL